MLCQATNAVSYSEQTVTVDYDYQVIDSFEGVDAKYVLGYSDTGYYCCAGYVSRFYEEKFGVTVYNINMVDDKPSEIHQDDGQLQLRQYVLGAGSLGAAALPAHDERPPHFPEPHLRPLLHRHPLG